MGTLSSPPCCPEDLPADVITRRVVDEDLPSVLAIYEEGLATRNATFETRLPTATQIRGRWMPGMAWVAELHGDVVRWTAVMPVSGRDCYAGVGETSVYVAEAARGRGVGKALLFTQVTEADKAGVWTLQTSIFPENRVSLALHHSAGYRTLAVRTALPSSTGSRGTPSSSSTAARSTERPGAVGNAKPARPRSPSSATTPHLVTLLPSPEPGGGDRLAGIVGGGTPAVGQVFDDGQPAASLIMDACRACGWPPSGVVGNSDIDAFRVCVDLEVDGGGAGAYGVRHQFTDDEHDVVAECGAVTADDGVESLGDKDPGVRGRVEVAWKPRSHRIGIHRNASTAMSSAASLLLRLANARETSASTGSSADV